MARKVDKDWTLADQTKKLDLYGANYRNFTQQIYADIRRETFGEDIGQQSWLTSKEQDRFISWLDLTENSRVLDLCCGAGGPAIRMARIAGCNVVGIDNDPNGIASARMMAENQGQSARTRFEVGDATNKLPFENEFFDSLICIDAINHLPDRGKVLKEWARVVRPQGKILFTDPITVTGLLTSVEIAVRSSIGFFIFTPPGEDERFLAAAGLRLLKKEDMSENMDVCARSRRMARQAREEVLRKIEGNETFEGQQEFLRVTEVLARERRLSRFVYLAENGGTRR